MPALRNPDQRRDRQALIVGAKQGGHFWTPIRGQSSRPIDNLASEIAQVPAKTLAGLKVKVRALFIIGELDDKQWDHPETWEWEYPHDGLVLSLMEDILAMEG